MTTEVTDKPQRSFDEDGEITDPAIIGAAEAYQDATEGVADSKETAKNALKNLQALVGQKEVEEGPHRVGRFIMNVARVAAHSRVRIKIAKT